MSGYLSALQNNLKNHALETVKDAAVTAAGTWGLSYAPKVTEWLQFQMPVENLAAGSVFNAVAGNAALVLGKTAVADKYKSDAVAIFTFALAVIAATYFAPQVAAFAGMQLTAEMAYAMGAVAIAQFVVRTLFQGETTPAAKPDERTAEQVKSLSKEDFAKLAKDLKFKDAAAQTVFDNRQQILAAKKEWDADKYKAACDDKGNFDIAKYV